MQREVAMPKWVGLDDYTYEQAIKWGAKQVEVFKEEYAEMVHSRFPSIPKEQIERDLGAGDDVQPGIQLRDIESN